MINTATWTKVSTGTYRTTDLPDFWVIRQGGIWGIYSGPAEDEGSWIGNARTLTVGKERAVELAAQHGRARLYIDRAGRLVAADPGEYHLPHNCQGSWAPAGRDGHFRQAYRCTYCGEVRVRPGELASWIKPGPVTPPPDAAAGLRTGPARTAAEHLDEAPAAAPGDSRAARIAAQHDATTAGWIARRDAAAQGRPAPLPAPAMVLVSVSNAHGTFTCTPEALDAAMAHYLPTSCRGLRVVIGDRNPGTDYEDVRTVTELLVMLADMDHPAVPPRPQAPADDRCATCGRDAHRPGREGPWHSYHGHPYQAPAAPAALAPLAAQADRYSVIDAASAVAAVDLDEDTARRLAATLPGSRVASDGPAPQYDPPQAGPNWACCPRCPTGLVRPGSRLPVCATCAAGLDVAALDLMARTGLAPLDQIDLAASAAAAARFAPGGLARPFARRYPQDYCLRTAAGTARAPGARPPGGQVPGAPTAAGSSPAPAARAARGTA